MDLLRDKMNENEKEKLQNIIDRLVSMERYMKRLNTDLYNYHTLTEDDRASLSFEYERFLKNLTWLRMEIATLKYKEGIE
jgi:hypothetical protein